MSTSRREAPRGIRGVRANFYDLKSLVEEFRNNYYCCRRRWKERGKTENDRDTCRKSSSLIFISVLLLLFVLVLPCWFSLSLSISWLYLIILIIIIRRNIVLVVMDWLIDVLHFYTHCFHNLIIATIAKWILYLCTRFNIKNYPVAGKDGFGDVQQFNSGCKKKWKKLHFTVVLKEATRISVYKV